MIIESHKKIPPRIMFGLIWKCPFCERIFIGEKGINRWCGNFIKRRFICFKCNDKRYRDSVEDIKGEKK